MTTALEQAQLLLNGDMVVRLHSVRAAAWLARSALEEAVQDLMLAKGCRAGTASARTRLACLEVLYEDSPDVASSAQYAWDRLSLACHYHSFELAPTHAEVVTLVDLVRQLEMTVGPD